jgi:hypothetical protein
MTPLLAARARSRPLPVLAQRLRAWTNRDVLYWKWRLVRAQLALVWSDFRSTFVLGCLQLAARLNAPIPDSAFRLAARFAGVRWPDDPAGTAIRAIYYGQPPAWSKEPPPPSPTRHDDPTA